MKITKAQLKKIIKEELGTILNEHDQPWVRYSIDKEAWDEYIALHGEFVSGEEGEYETVLTFDRGEVVVPHGGSGDYEGRGSSSRWLRGRW
jgi:hypothetical protein